MKRLPPILLYLFTAMVLMAAGVLCLYESPAAPGKTHHELVYGFNLISARPVRQVDRPLELLQRPVKENPAGVLWGRSTTAGRAVSLVLGGGNDSAGEGVEFTEINHLFSPEHLPVISCGTSQVLGSVGVGLLPVLLGRMSREPADSSVLSA